MSRLYSLLLIFLVSLPLFAFGQKDKTVIILVRHGEADKATGNNPSLSATGKALAERLPEILKGYDVDEIYSTPFNRTMQTAAPLATKEGITVKTYDAFNLRSLADSLKRKKGTIVVFGHSNTAPSLANYISGLNRYVNIPESVFDRAYIITIKEDKVVIEEKSYEDLD
ncbi:MAG: hypothetical protein EOO04_26535 [Chitinophagaceae bacterium]|nr:MAG: hypothetical protein EOO04_26535 [Chitinophagaceae bacterium]